MPQRMTLKILRRPLASILIPMVVECRIATLMQTVWRRKFSRYRQFIAFRLDLQGFFLVNRRCVGVWVNEITYPTGTSIGGRRDFTYLQNRTVVVRVR
jgi:hypothetical protein